MQNGRLEKKVVKVQNSKDLVIRNKSMRISNVERLIERLQKAEEQQRWYLFPLCCNRCRNKNKFLKNGKYYL